MSAGCRDAAARFAGDDDRTHRSLFQVNSLGCRHLAKMNGVRWCAAEHSDAIVDDCLEPRHGPHTAAGHTQAAQCLSRVKGSPEPEERSKREGKEDPVAGVDTCGAGRPLECRLNASSPVPRPRRS